MRSIKRIDVDAFVGCFTTIEDVNNTKNIFIFDEDYSQEELNDIYDLIVNNWKASHISEIDSLYYETGKGHVVYAYSKCHEIIQRKMILVKNCDIYNISSSAHELFKYLKDTYQLIYVLSQHSITSGREELIK